MIDQKLIDATKLVQYILDTRSGNHHAWWELVEIVPEYRPPHAAATDSPRCVVKYGQMFLRWSCGPIQGYFWDIYGDDFKHAEWALLGLMDAPVPPGLLKEEVWKALRAKLPVYESARILFQHPTTGDGPLSVVRFGAYEVGRPPHSIKITRATPGSAFELNVDLEIHDDCFKTTMTDPAGGKFPPGDYVAIIHRQ